MNKLVQYKQFDIAIRANLNGSPSRFDVVWQIRRVKDNSNLVHSRFISKEFDSEKAGYEFGLLEARIWIDDHTHCCRNEKD